VRHARRHASRASNRPCQRRQARIPGRNQPGSRTLQPQTQTFVDAKTEPIQRPTSPTDAARAHRHRPSQGVERHPETRDTAPKIHLHSGADAADSSGHSIESGHSSGHSQRDSRESRESRRESSSATTSAKKASGGRDSNEANVNKETNAKIGKSKKGNAMQY